MSCSHAAARSTGRSSAGTAAVAAAAARATPWVCRDRPSRRPSRSWARSRAAAMRGWAVAASCNPRCREVGHVRTLRRRDTPPRHASRCCGADTPVARRPSVTSPQLRASDRAELAGASWQLAQRGSCLPCGHTDPAGRAGGHHTRKATCPGRRLTSTCGRQVAERSEPSPVGSRFDRQPAQDGPSAAVRRRLARRAPAPCIRFTCRTDAGSVHTRTHPGGHR